jgi:hypothetical protein
LKELKELLKKNGVFFGVQKPKVFFPTALALLALLTKISDFCSASLQNLRFCNGARSASACMGADKNRRFLYRYKIFDFVTVHARAKRIERTSKKNSVFLLKERRQQVF